MRRFLPAHLFFINLDLQSDWRPIIHEILRLHLQGASLLPSTTCKVSQHVPHRQLCITLKHERKGCSSSTTPAVLITFQNNNTKLPECIPCRPGPRLTRSCQSTPPPAGCLSDWLPPELAGLTGCHGDYECQSSLGAGPEPSGLQLQLIWRQREKARDEPSGERIQTEKHDGK